MSPHASTIDQLPVMNGQQLDAMALAESIDGLLALWPENIATAVWLHFPASEGAHPGIQYGGNKAYPKAEGWLEIGVNDAGQHIITLRLTERQKIGRPHFLMGVGVVTAEENAARYDALQVLIDHDSDRPLIMLGLTADAEPTVLTGYFPRDMHHFVDVCIKAYDKKSREILAAHPIGHLAGKAA